MRWRIKTGSFLSRSSLRCLLSRSVAMASSVNFTARLLEEWWKWCSVAAPAVAINCSDSDDWSWFCDCCCSSIRSSEIESGTNGLLLLSVVLGSNNFSTMERLFRNGFRAYLLRAEVVVVVACAAKGEVLDRSNVFAVLHRSGFDATRLKLNGPGGLSVWSLVLLLFLAAASFVGVEFSSLMMSLLCASSGFSATLLVEEMEETCGVKIGFWGWYMA